MSETKINKPSEEEIKTIKGWYDAMARRNRFSPLGQVRDLYDKLYGTKNNVPSCSCTARSWIKKMYDEYGK
jgi:hypothetical protein